MRALIVILTALSFGSLQAEPLLGAVQIYSQDELINLINQNKHLKRVRDDECQLVADIEARASKMKVPAYQFLYGDMLLYGVCVPTNGKLGMYYIEQSAEQGLPAGLEQLGRYYAQGRFVRPNKALAVHYFYRAASVGHLVAQIQLVDLYLQGYGTPSDYYYAYHWLHNAVITDKQQQQEVTGLLARLARKMPEAVVNKAKQPLERDF